MIGRLRGILLEKEPTNIVVEAGGVGYRVFVPLTTFTKLEAEKVDLFIHTEVRSDAIQLFGFLSRTERDLFRKLLAVQGVGPMTGLAVLSGLSVDELATAIRSADSARLQSIPRIGKRTAERIILELKDKLGSLGEGIEGSLGAGPTTPDFDDALSALENLGYKSANVRKALEKARESAPEGPIEAWIRIALKAL